MSTDDFRPVSLAGLRHEVIPEVTWLVDQMIPADEVVQLVAWHGIGKSRISLSLALSVASGTDFFGYKVPAAQDVVILTAEDSLREIKRRVQKLGEALDPAVADAAFERIRVWDFKTHHRPLAVADSDGVRPTTDVDLIAGIIGNAGLVIIDTLARFSGVPENDNTAMAALLTAVEQIRQKTNATVMVIHHSGRANKSAGRGASSFESGVRCQLVLTRLEGEALKKQGFDEHDDKILELHVAKNSYGPDGTRLLLHDMGTSYVPVNPTVQRANQLTKFWTAWIAEGKPAFSPEKASWSGMSRRTLQALIAYGETTGAIIGAKNQQKTFSDNYLVTQGGVSHVTTH